MNKFLTYFHTIKYLKPSQIVFRVLRKLTRPKKRQFNYSIADRCGHWHTQYLYPQKLFAPKKAVFLNHSQELSLPSSWNDKKQAKLWLYNLHYFDDLNSHAAESRRSMQLELMNLWVNQNPHGFGNGWEPYPSSLRIVNWIKAFLTGVEPNKELITSLAMQADYLSQNLEKHLLGNHYFANLKALIFAGCYFQGERSNKWLLIGLRGLQREFNEQVLKDGLNFELTPMYHSIMLVDILDLINLNNTFENTQLDLLLEELEQKILLMLRTLNLMSHGDDRLSFFNDSSFGVAPENSTIREYSEALGFECKRNDEVLEDLKVFDQTESGYVIVKSAEMTLIADLSPIGPDYLPGHAHADNLSFELSLGVHRVFVNSGISEYGVTTERLRQRGTKAHNTVCINGENSSEVWSGFRVARRARIVKRKVSEVTSEGFVTFSAGHTGYINQGIDCIHYRTWVVSSHACEIEDTFEGTYDSAIGYLHLHPSVKLLSIKKQECILEIGSYKIYISCANSILSTEESTWQPEFGVSLRNLKLIMDFNTNIGTAKITWSKT